MPIKIYTKLCLVWNKQAVAAEDFTTSCCWRASKIPKQNKIQLASLQIGASLLFAAIAEQTFRCCAASPAPAFSPESCARRMQKMFKVVGGRRADPPCPSLVPPRCLLPRVHPGASASHHTTYFWTSPRRCSMHRAEFEPLCLPFTRKKQAPCPAEGPTRAEPAGFFDASRELQGQHGQPGEKPAVVPCSGGLQGLASYFLCHALTQINVHLLYVRTLRLDLLSIAFKCFIYFPENRQFCSRTQGEIPTSLKALSLCH